MKYTSQLIALSFLALGSLNASAAVYYSQNFDTLVLGNIAGQTDSGPLAPSDSWSGPGVVQNTVAVSGQALQVALAGDATYRPGVFDTNLASANQVVQFDFRLQSTVVGPNVSMQSEVLVRGPLANQNFYFVYKGLSNPGGDILQNEFRLVYNSFNFITSTTPTANNWYRVTLDINFSTASIDALVTDLNTNTTFWDPAAVTGFNPDGNTNGLGLTATGPGQGFYLDNLSVQVIPEPTSVALVIVGLGGVLMMRSRRARR